MFKMPKVAFQFYEMDPRTCLLFSQEDIGNAQTGSNWRVLLSYFNLVQILESSGIGLIYGLRFYSIGQLTQEDTTKYIRTNALLYEYYKQAREMIPQDIGKILQKLFTSDEYILVNTRYQLTRGSVTNDLDKNDDLMTALVIILQ